MMTNKTAAFQAGNLAVGEVRENWAGDARFYEYTKAADPIGSGFISPIPASEFSAELYTTGPTRIVPLDLSEALGTDYPATSPSLLAHFIRIKAGERLETNPNATSELYYIISGRGYTEIDGVQIHWKAGDFLTLPAGSSSKHVAEEDTTCYYVLDTPLLDYLGVTATTPRFRPVLFAGEKVRAELELAASAPDAHKKNRISVLLNNAAFNQTLTITHTLWAMFGVVPIGAIQLPHSHKSVALDFVVDCKPGCYTLVGDQVDPVTKQIVNPLRIDWEPGKAFVTPPGKWHSHHNESGAPAYILPIQDAGLQTYLRTLDIQFVTRD
ncbi:MULTISPECIES: cupin domain-containing protein [Aneurinibacillus]|nr:MULTISPECIES: cupin domain-containing protein [Aneurinibacillus]